MQVVYNLRSTIVMGRLLLLIKHVFCLQDKIHISIIHPSPSINYYPYLSLKPLTDHKHSLYLDQKLKKKKKKILMCIVDSSTTQLYQF